MPIWLWKPSMWVIFRGSPEVQLWACKQEIQSEQRAACVIKQGGRGHVCNLETKVPSVTKAMGSMC